MNGNPPFAIPDNTQTMSAALTGSEVNKLPSLDYFHKCRVVVQNLKNMLDDCILGKAYNWHKIFTNGTTRRKIKFQNLVIGLMTDGDFE